MNTDYSYCSGVTCSIRKSCKRYLPDPPDTRLQWVWPAYNPGTDNGRFNVIPDSMNWDNFYKKAEIIRWAYIEDLLPNMED